MADECGVIRSVPDWLRRLLIATAGIVAVSFIIVFTLWVLRYVLIVLMPFIIAGIFTLFMEPLVRFFSRRLPRGLAVLITMFIFFAGAGLIVTLLVAHLITELGDLSRRLPLYISEFQQILNVSIAWVRKGYGSLPPEAVQYLENTISAVTNSAGNTVSLFISSFLNFLGSLPNAALVFVVSFIATYFISRDRKAMGRFWTRVVPAPWDQQVLLLGQKAFSAFLAYLRAQLILVTLTMFLSTVGLYILHVKYALTMGLVIGFFDLLPVLGPSAVFVPWIIIAFLTGTQSFGLKLLVLYIVVFAIRQIFEARIVAMSLGLHPLVVMVGMYAGLKLIGVAGLILGPIVVIIIQAAYKAARASMKGKKI
ncbi:MAG: sporulation integral membrane protein YtvI [Bacillota bacterium]